MQQNDFADKLKWIATSFVVAAVFFRSQHEHSLQVYDIVLSFIGCALWIVVGVLWKDRAVITLNSILTVMLLISIVNIFG